MKRDELTRKEGKRAKKRGDAIAQHSNNTNTCAFVLLEIRKCMMPKDATPVLLSPTGHTSQNVQPDDYWACVGHYTNPELMPGIRSVL